jgi:predicted ABC-type ATPase
VIVSADQPSLDLIVGPNGAGKTTFARLIVLPLFQQGVFVNADMIAAQRWPEAQAEHAYEAARVADAVRADLMSSKTSFVTETVFSHPSKVDLIRDAQRSGFYVRLHVILVPLELSLQRVPQRVREGGHDVPQHKIIERYERLWPLVARGLMLADEGTVHDTSRGGPTVRVLDVRRGVPVMPPQWPSWTPHALLDTWPIR